MEEKVHKIFDDLRDSGFSPQEFPMAFPFQVNVSKESIKRKNFCGREDFAKSGPDIYPKPLKLKWI
jgi:hypothetical protein